MILPKKNKSETKILLRKTEGGVISLRAQDQLSLKYLGHLCSHQDSYLHSCCALFLN